MSPGAVLPHRQCGTGFGQQEQPKTNRTMATLRDFESEYLSSDPEVFVDFLSIKSLKKRYVGSSNSDNGVFCQWNQIVDDDFETFVQEFPIDDNISECFAYSSDDTIKDLEGTVSEDDSHVAKRSKEKAAKDARTKVSEAVCHIEKKLAENNRRLKGGANFFRRKGKQSAMPKKSFSVDDLRTTGTGGADSARQSQTKAPFRRCRALQQQQQQQQQPVNNQRIESLSHYRPNAAVYDSIVEKNNPAVSDQWTKEKSKGVEPLKSCLRNGDAKEDHIDLRLIRTRPDEAPTGSLKLQRTGQSGIIGHRVLRKALRDSVKGKTTAAPENQFSSVCMACRDLKLTEIGSTTAHSAAYMGHLQCLQALVENAADITAVNHDGMQPSQVALSTGHFDCWNYLTVAELSHVLLRELCNYGSLIERITTQLDSVRSEMVKVKQCLEKKSQDLNRQVKCLLDLTTAISRNLVTYPSNKQKCLGHPGSMYQDVQDSLTLLERIDRKLNDLCNVDCAVVGSDSFRGLEMAVHKTEDLLQDDVHMNDIRQLENVQKRNRVIRNFLIEDEQRLNNRLRNSYAESVSSESIVSRGGGGRVRQMQTRAIVEPVPPSIASTSSSHFNGQDRRRKPEKKKHHHNHHHRHKQNLDISKLTPPAAPHPTAVRSHYRPRRRSKSASSSRQSPMRSSSSGSSESLSCSDSETASSDWETTSQGSTGTLNVHSDVSDAERPVTEALKTGIISGATRGAQRGPPSCDWSFLQSAVQDDRHKTKNRDSLSQSSLEVCIGYADRASSVGSLRQHRLANHFLHIEKETKQKSGLMERVIKGDDDRHETASSSASVPCKRYSQDQDKRTLSYNSHTGVISGSNVNYSPKGIKTREGPFSSASSSSPTSSRRTVIRNSALDEVKTTRLKPPLPMNFVNASALREELIGRCRQVPMDIHDPSRPVGTFENSFHDKPWYDVSDDETSVCTWTNEVPGYESESSFYQ